MIIVFFKDFGKLKHTTKDNYEKRIRDERKVVTWEKGTSVFEAIETMQKWYGGNDEYIIDKTAHE